VESTKSTKSFQISVFNTVSQSITTETSRFQKKQKQFAHFMCGRQSTDGGWCGQRLPTSRARKTYDDYFVLFIKRRLASKNQDLQKQIISSEDL